MENRKKIGLALGSGGVKGLSHIGVIKILAGNNIPIDYIAGSSVGALIGAGYAAYQNIEKIKNIALTHNWKTAFNLFDPTLRGGLIKGKKVGRLIKEWLDEIDFSDLKIPLTVITTDLATGEEIDISKGSLTSAIRASMAVPPVFKPIEYNGHLLSDGGLSNPLPSDIVKQMGADIVIAVNLDSGKFNQNGHSNFLNKKHKSLAKISVRALNIIRYHLAKTSVQTADINIDPAVEEIGLVGWNKFFDNRQVSEIIKAGEKAALKALPEIKKILTTSN